MHCEQSPSDKPLEFAVAVSYNQVQALPDLICPHLTELENAPLICRLADEEMAYGFQHALTPEITQDGLLLTRWRAPSPALGGRLWNTLLRTSA